MASIVVIDLANNRPRLHRGCRPTMNMLHQDRGTPKFQIEEKKITRKNSQSTFHSIQIFYFACLVAHSSANQMQIKLDKKQKNQIEKSKSPR